MNASRRIARKHNVLRNGLTAIPPTAVGVRKRNMLKGVLQFVMTATHRQLARQAVKLGLIMQSPRSLHHKRTGIATR